MTFKLRILLPLSALVVTGCGPALTPGLATIPSPQPVCLRLSYGREKRLPERPTQLRLAPGTQTGYVDWPGDAHSGVVGEWTHDGGSWLWITLPVSGTTLRYILVTTGSTVRGQVTSDGQRSGELPGVAAIAGDLIACPQ